MSLRAVSSSVMTGTGAPQSATPSGSPWVYQNTASSRVQVAVSGGTVTLIEFSRDGTTWVPCGLLAGLVTLNPSDRVRVTYAVAPTVNVIPC